MLYEEQAAELLARCEAIAGRSLKQLRGNLLKANTRAEAVWELLVLEAAAQLGPVECESPQGGPDIRLRLPTGRWVSIEVTYLHPRFEDEELRSRSVTSWMAEAASKIGPQRVAIECAFDWGEKTPAGFRLRLPAEHERRLFMSQADVAGFLARVSANPSQHHEVKLAGYTVTLRSRPRTSDRDRFVNSSGPVLEQPRDVAEHAAFRALRTKLQQHKVDEPYIVCIGSDVSRVLGTDWHHGVSTRLQDALGAAARRSKRLTAVLVAKVETDMPGLGRAIVRRVNGTLYSVPDCRHQLLPEEMAVLEKLNLNRWKLTFPLARREPLKRHRHRKVGGSMSISGSGRDGGVMKLTVPASVLVDVLAGRSSMSEHYGGEHSTSINALHHCLREGRCIVGCSFMPGDLQQAAAGQVVLLLGAPHDPVYWPRGEVGEG